MSSCRDVNSTTNRPFKAMTIVVTLVAFFVNIFAYELASAAEVFPRVIASPASSVIASPKGAKQSPFNFHLPEYLGYIKDSYRGQSPSAFAKASADKSGTVPLVIHIQDAHCNYAAQNTIAGIIDYLNREYGINTVNLEGGEEGYDLSPFYNLKDANTRNKVADYFLKEGEINAAEFYAINNPSKITLWGVENTDLYLKNLNVYRDSLRSKGDVDKSLKTLNYILASLKVKVYSKELLALDQKANDFKNKAMELRDYVGYLTALSKDKNPDTADLKNFDILTKTLLLEKGIDFKKANIERDQLIDSLNKCLSKNEIKELVQKAVEFKMGRMQPAEFYAYLAGKAREVDIDLAGYNNMNLYIGYINLYSTLKKEDAFKEIEALEGRIKEMLYQNPEQRELNRLSKHLALMRNLLNITLTQEDFKYYKEHRKDFGVENFIRFIKAQAPKHGLDLNINGDLKNLNSNLQDMERFYELSYKRDEEFVKRLTTEGSPERSRGKGLSSTSSLRAPKGRSNLNNVAILITGGFHSENLASIFKKKGLSYISIMPNFGLDDKECPYFKLLAGKDSILQRYMSPEASTLAHYAPFNEHAPDVYGARIKEARLACVNDVAAGKTPPAGPRESASGKAGDQTPEEMEKRIRGDIINACKIIDKIPAGRDTILGYIQELLKGFGKFDIKIDQRVRRDIEFSYSGKILYAKFKDVKIMKDASIEELMLSMMLALTPGTWPFKNFEARRITDYIIDTWARHAAYARWHGPATGSKAAPRKSSLTHYKVLGMPQDAGDTAIKKAYRHLAATKYPDLIMNAEEAKLNPEAWQEANDAFRVIIEAYEVLGDPRKRTEYDRRIGLRESASGKIGEEPERIEPSPVSSLITPSTKAPLAVMVRGIVALGLISLMYLCGINTILFLPNTFQELVGSFYQYMIRFLGIPLAGAFAVSAIGTIISWVKSLFRDHGEGKFGSALDYRVTSPYEKALLYGIIGGIIAVSIMSSIILIDMLAITFKLHISMNAVSVHNIHGVLQTISRQIYVKAWPSFLTNIIVPGIGIASVAHVLGHFYALLIVGARMKYSKFIINFIQRVIRIEYERPPQLYKNVLIDASGYLANGMIGILAGISFIYYYYANGAPASLRDASFFVQPFGYLSMLFGLSAINILYFFLNMFVSLNGEGKLSQMYRLHRYLAKKGDDAFTLIESKHGPIRTGVEDREVPRRDSASGAARDASGYTLPVEMTSKLVERKGPVLEPLKINGEYLEYILNAGVLALDHKRFLFARITQTRPVRGAETKRSEIGLYIHNDQTGETIAIDKKMLVPDGLKNVIALEDPRVIERDGTIFVYLTVVRKNGSYYSAVMTHDTKRFLDIVEKKQKNVEISWEWTPPLRLITDGPAAKENIKNFVPFGNPSVEALYRPDTLERSTIRLARSEDGLAGPWKDAGLFMTVDPEKGWLGPSAYIPGMPEIPGSIPLELMLIHYGAGGEGVNGYKYYDLRLMVSDRNDPKKNYVIPLMAPKLGEAYEGETDREKVWVPGTIYSCGAVLKEYDVESGDYVLDIYYSGSDTAVLLATVTVNIKYMANAGQPMSRDSASGKSDANETAERIFELLDDEDMGAVLALSMYPVLSQEGQVRLASIVTTVNQSLGLNLSHDTLKNKPFFNPLCNLIKQYLKTPASERPPHKAAVKPDLGAITQEIFNSLKDEERSILRKRINGEPLSDTEKAVLNGLNQRATDIILANKLTNEQAQEVITKLQPMIKEGAPPERRASVPRPSEEKDMPRDSVPRPFEETNGLGTESSGQSRDSASGRAGSPSLEPFRAVRQAHDTSNGAEQRRSTKSRDGEEKLKANVAAEEMIDRMRGWVSTREHSAPSHIPGNSELEDIAAVLAGTKPAAICSKAAITEEAVFNVLLEKARQAGFKVMENKYGYVIGKESNVESIVKLVDEAGREDRPVSDDYHRNIGRALGYHEDGIKDFIGREKRSIRQNATDLLGAVRFPGEERILFVPAFDKDNLNGVYQNVASEIRHELDDFNVRVIFYDGTEKGLEEAYAKARPHLDKPNALALAYILEGKHAAASKIFADHPNVKLMQENIPDGANIEAGLHVILGLGILDYVRNNRREVYDYQKLLDFIGSLGDMTASAEDIEKLKKGDINILFSPNFVFLPRIQKVDINKIDEWKRQELEFARAA